MKEKKSKALWVMGVALLAILAGCSGDEKTSSTPQGEATRLQAVLSDADRPVETAQGPMTVSIVPARPVTSDDLRALVQGCGRIGGFHWEVNGTPVAEVSGDELPHRYFKKGDTVTVSVRAEKDSAIGQTSIVNAPPEVLSVPFVDADIHGGAAIEVAPDAVDLDGDRVDFRYRWTVNGEELALLDSPTLPADKVHKGDRISLHVVPFDGVDEGPVFTGIEFVVPNSPPEFVSSPPATFEGRLYRYAVEAKDSDGDAVTYSLESAPENMVIDSGTGVLEWQIARGDSGEHRIKIVAQDDEGMRAFQEYSLSLSIPE